MLLSVVRGGKEAAGAVTRREHVHGVETPASTAPYAAQRNPLNYFRSFFYSGLRHVGPCTSTTCTPYLTRRRLHPAFVLFDQIHDVLIHLSVPQSAISSAIRRTLVGFFGRSLRHLEGRRGRSRIMMYAG